MVFASLNFIFLFFPVFLAAYFILPYRAYRNFMLFIFSLIFYAWAEPAYVFVMVCLAHGLSFWRMLCRFITILAAILIWP